MDSISATPISLHMGPRRGFRTGIAVSLLLHALLIYGYRMQRGAPAPAAAPVERLTVWLRPLAAPPAPAPAPAPALAKAEAEPRPAAERPRQQATRAVGKKTDPLAITAPAAQPDTLPAEPSTTTNATAGASVPADPFATPAAPVKPGFDIEAARRTARRVANEKDPAKIGTGLERLPEKQLADETALARDIASGKRGDCRTAYAGAGLLAPLFMLMDKKDSGCKF